MTPAERSQLLRERFKGQSQAERSVAGVGIARAVGKSSDRPKRVRYVVLPKPTGRGFVSVGPAQWRECPAWVKTPDRADTPAIGLKRRHGTPVLAKVAKHIRAKLPRLKLREPWQLAKVNL